uniref:acyltransferase Pun1-like n=1 Tax=Erigeron canadensis TaxID=72917 RepID=UPI001CB9BF11|nr:acyltransferase Pun1-like [Erigeron canadensis]
MAKIQRFVKIRRFHTITHQETIKPACQTPPQQKLHNLSMLDHIIPNVHIPLVFFYKNYKSCDINILKKALSKNLTQYYPFAGRYLNAPFSPHIHCNDEGVEFLEASIDIPLYDFVLKRDVDETILNKLIPNGLGCAVNKTSSNMLEVQLNHFPCSGAALAVSISHKVGDGLTMANFLSHWATVTRGGLPINPSFISSNIKDTANLLDFYGNNGKLLSKAIKKSAGSVQLSNLGLVVNMREKISTSCPKAMAGNIFTTAIAKMIDSGEIQLNKVITSLRKDRLDIQGIRDVEEVGKMFLKTLSTLADDQNHRTYMCSSVCRFPFYQVDFGWGKPERVIIVTTGILGSSHFVVMDTASRDGIEAIVHLEEGEMAILQNHKELLLYVEDN